VPPQSANTSSSTDQQGASSFSLQYVQRMLEESLGSVQKSIHEDVRNLHIELLRQFHMQEVKLLDLYSGVAFCFKIPLYRFKFEFQLSSFILFSLTYIATTMQDLHNKFCIWWGWVLSSYLDQTYECWCNFVRYFSLNLILSRGSCPGKC
jgi:hypothetical protein